ncbi:MAG: PEP-CTERM sorting domain-containing protein [Acidobacteriota bacterium]|nr:PEP-CTERM sorting domain-containing protein [Acidobacteriota bacterium]
MLLTRQILIASLALLLPVVPAGAAPLVYIVAGPPIGSAQFGTLDLATGAFTHIADTEGSQGLVPGPNGSLLTLSFSGNLNSINPTTGITSVIGATGLVDCSVPPDSPCGPHSANALASVGGQVYVTDFANNLFSVNTMTGVATLIGPTGIPVVPFTPVITNPDNTFNAYDEGLFGANGKLYATFDAFTVSLDTFTTASIVIAPILYQIDPKTGLTTLIGPTDLNLNAVTGVNGTYYAFNDGTNQVVTLDLATGRTSPVTSFNPAIGIITGATATPVPEPASIALAAAGLAAIVICKRRKTPFMVFLTGAISSAFGQTPTFTAIDFPGAASTQPWGSNTRGDIVGQYVSGGVTHGFLLNAGQFSTIDFPNATGTELYAINPRGDVVGVYALAGARHGFLLSGGQFTKIDFPDATKTEVSGFNPRGDITGDYATADNVTHGYLLSGGQFSTIDFPGATYTGATAVNARGDIVGRYRNADGVFHGFLLVGFRPACGVSVSAPKIAGTSSGAAVTHGKDFTLVTAAKPSTAGEVLTLFATGLGPTRPSVNPGQAFPSSPLAPVDSLVEVRVNGRSAVVLGAYGFPGAVDGYQVNFRLPADTMKGSAAIELSAAGVAGTPVTIVVQ